MYVLRLRNDSDGLTSDFCVLEGNGFGPETHIRVTNIHVSGPADSDGQVLLGNTTTSTVVSECDGKSCDSSRILDRVMIFSHDLADSARNLIHAWRVTRGEADRRAVSSGPSREDLFDSLRLSREDRSVIFLIKPMASDFVSFPEADTNLPFEISVRVRRIESMGKSGCDWKIVLYDFNSTFGKPYLVGTYNSTSRRGWLTPAASI